jgi:hypothetical protein
LPIKNVTQLEICELAPVELDISDEGMDYAFLSVYDSFITLFLSKEKKNCGFFFRQGIRSGRLRSGDIRS